LCTVGAVVEKEKLFPSVSGMPQHISIPHQKRRNVWLFFVTKIFVVSLWEYWGVIGEEADRWSYLENILGYGVVLSNLVGKVFRLRPSYLFIFLFSSIFL
jgi:hypothetical protein